MGRTNRRSFKGCCPMCAARNGKVKGQGRGAREPARDKRQRGKARRVGRNDIPADQLAGAGDAHVAYRG